MNNPSLDKLPPYNLEAEQSVLGACIHSSEAFYKALEIINTDDFYKSSHRKIFSSMQGWFSKNKQVDIDVLTLCDVLSARDSLTEVGGIEYLSLLEDYIPTTTAVTHHSKIVKDKSIVRAVIKMSDSLLRVAYEDQLPAEELLVKVNSEALKLKNTKSGDIRDYDFIVKDTLRRLESDSSRGLLTGLKSIDKMTGGMHPGESIILAARPGMGKTSLALDIAENVAREGFGVGIFSLEMSVEEIGDKRLLRAAHVNTMSIRNNHLQKEDYSKLHDAGFELSKLPIYIDDTASMNLSSICARAMRMKREWDIKLLVVDYLHLISSGSCGSRSRHEDLSELSRGIKILAKELNIPILLLSQLNRACEDRADKRPELRDLRESGAIEQDADMVWFIYREAFYQPDKIEIKRDAEVLVRKQRHGPKGTAELLFIPEMSSFKNE